MSAEDDLTHRLRDAARGVPDMPPDLGEVEAGAAARLRRRRITYSTAVVVLVALTAVAGFMAGRSGSEGDPEVLAAPVAEDGAGDETGVGAGGGQEDDAGQQEDAAAAIGEEPVLGRDVFGIGLSSSITQGERYDLVSDQLTPEGFRVRVGVGPRWDEGEGGPGGWQPPGWCFPAANLRVAVTSDDVVDIGLTGWHSEVKAPALASGLTLGHADGQELRVVAAQVPDGVESVAVTYDDGAGARAPVFEGVAVLVTPGAGNPAAFELELTGPDGTTTVGAEDLVISAPERNEACEPPPPSLPPPGEQPAVPALAEAEVRENMLLLYNSEIPFADKPEHLLDNWTGVAEAAEVVRQNFGTTVDSAIAEVEALVFTSPTEAWFRYSIDSEGFFAEDRFGIARLIDDHWRITRGTYCQDLALGGGQCDGSLWPTITPEQFFVDPEERPDPAPLPAPVGPGGVTSTVVAP